MRTRISPKLLWIEPFLDLGKKFISEDRKISRLGAWSRGKSRGSNEHAALIQRKIGEPHRIWLHTHYIEDSKEKPFSKIDLLEHLAHELAHTENWKHTPRHKKLEATILIAFMELLEKSGYISEEKELGK